MRFTHQLLGTLGLALSCIMNTAAAQSTAPIHLIVPYPPGGGSDFVARTIAPEMSKALNRTIVIENLSGAGGAIGSQRVLQRNPDGNTLLLGSPNEVILAPAVNTALDYKAEDFRLIGPATITSQVLVARPTLDVKNADELIRMARTTSDKAGISYGSVGIGSLYHVTGAVLAEQTGGHFFHVPYRGAAPLVQDLMGGQVDIAFLPLAGNVLSLIREGKLKALGIAEKERNPLAPEIPTLGESVPELAAFHYPTWAGILVRANTPDDITTQLQEALAHALKDPKIREAIQASGSSVGTPFNLQQAADQYRQESAQFQQIVNTQKIAVN